MTNDKASKDTPQRGVSRRDLLLGTAAGTLGAVTLPGMARAGKQARSNADDTGGIIDLAEQHAFYGNAGQAGIQTPMQHYVYYMTFDLTSASRRDLQVLLARWSAAIAQLMKGEPMGQVEPTRPYAIGADTGEALNIGPANLTVTVGLGPNVFTESFGLAGKKPPKLRELNAMPSDNLDPDFTGGDLSLQACADDPQVAYHAVRDLARIAKETSVAATRWTMHGFFRNAAGRKKVTPRNLFGFRDGTRNLHTGDELDKHVWIKNGPRWQHNGSYQVVRKIKMEIETWDTNFVADQMRIFGRHKVSGAPLTGKHEFDTPDFKARDKKGNPVIDPAAHIRLSAFENNNGIRILRRAYNYTEGINKFGFLDAGLLFLTYQNDPAHFEQLQTKLGAVDALNEYISHIGSAIFYVPPAPKEGSYIGQELFA